MNMFSKFLSTEVSVRRTAIILLIAGPIALYLSFWLAIGDAADAAAALGLLAWVYSIPLLLGCLTAYSLVRRFKTQWIWLGTPVYIVVWSLIYVPLVFRGM